MYIHTYIYVYIFLYIYLRTVTCQTPPESGCDCLMCPIFARQWSYLVCHHRSLGCGERRFEFNTKHQNTKSEWASQELVTAEGRLSLSLSLYLALPLSRSLSLPLPLPLSLSLSIYIYLRMYLFLFLSLSRPQTKQKKGSRERCEHTLHPKPHTLNPEPSTLNPKP